ncbi:hypothetical protein C0J52_06640, partial [Blattella germanica]
TLEFTISNIVTYLSPTNTSCRFLGLYLESSLGWLTHVNHVSSKLSGTGIYMLRMLRASFVYYAHFHSHMSYGLLFMVWPVESLNCRKEPLELSAATHREVTVDHFLLNVEY